MNAAMVERRLSCVFLRATRRDFDVQGPVGNGAASEGEYESNEEEKEF